MTKILLDCGAHEFQGYYHLKEKLGIESSWEVHAFECNPNTCHRAKVPPNVVLHTNAVWIENETIDFAFEDVDDGTGQGSTTNTTLLKKYPESFRQIVQVQAIDFAEFITSNFRPDDHIAVKMDIEGAEIAVIDHLIETGAISYIDQLFVEYHDVDSPLSKYKHEGKETKERQVEFFRTANIEVEVDGRKLASQVFGFMHVAIMGNWREIYTDQLRALQTSGLAQKTEKILVSVVGPHVELELLDNMEIMEWHPNTSASENFTLDHLVKKCRTLPSSKVWYIHTKGASWSRETLEKATLWRRYMEHFIIEQHEICIDALEEHDICGVDWRPTIFDVVPNYYFMGNFWWATSDYIRRLPPTVLKPNTNRYAAEVNFIGQGHPRVATLHQSHKLNVYEDPFHEWEYRTPKHSRKTALSTWIRRPRIRRKIRRPVRIVE